MTPTPTPTPAATPRDPLSQRSVVDAAVRLADDEGVDGVTMRKLAARLGYEVMSLYNHVANKDELLALMVDHVAAEIDIPPPDTAPLTAARVLAVAHRDVLVRHPWAPELWQRWAPGPARTDVMERLLRAMSESGLSSTLAHHGFHAVTNHILGYTLQERQLLSGGRPGGGAVGGLLDAAHDFLAGISPERHPFMIAHVHQHLDGDTSSSFELVLDLILDGLVRLNDPAVRPPH